MTDRAVTTLALAMAGTLAAHQLGYGMSTFLAASGGVPDHAHMGPMIGVSLAIAAIAGAVLMVRRAGAPAPGAAALAATQTVLFLVLEVAERHGDVVALVSSPAVWWGLAAQPLIAWVVLWLVGVGRLVAARLAHLVPVPAPGADVPVVGGTSALLVPGRFVLRRWRGPPA